MKTGTTEIQLRFSDLDAYGHVNNATYLSYLEAARIELLYEEFTRDMHRGIQYLLVGVNLEYKLPITLEDRVLVECWVSEAGGVRLKFSYRVHNGEGKLFATGETTHALFDAQTKRPMRLPAEWKVWAAQ